MVSGVASSIDPDSGFAGVVSIRAGQHAHLVFKPLLDRASPILLRGGGLADAQLLELARRVVAIEREHGGAPTRVAWELDERGRLDVRDARLETPGAAEGPQELVETRTRISLSVSHPARAFRWWRLPAAGIGLVRLELVIRDWVGVHPLALTRFEQLTDVRARRRIAELTRGFEDRRDYFVERLASGVAMIAASVHPRPVVVRFSDFETHEYAAVLGGAELEPVERNPILGWHGAVRYDSAGYREGFALECRALRRVREQMGLDNVALMIPFCRTPEEADRVSAALAREGLRRGERGLELHVMCEVPSSVLLADELAGRFDGLSIGTNDLTQLVLGVDARNPALAHVFDERHAAVLRAIEHVVGVGRERGVPVTVCGHRASRDPEYARVLVEAGVDGVCVEPESFADVQRRVVEAEGPRA